MYRNPTLNESTVTLQFGKVVGVRKGYIKVQIADFDDLVTDWLPFCISGDTKDNKDYKMPSMGAQVSLLLDAHGERGTVLGSIYSDVDDSTSPNESADHSTFKDGAVIEYDPESSKLLVQGVKDIEVIGTGNTTVVVDGDVNISTGQNITLNASLITLNAAMTVITGGISAGSGMARGFARAASNYTATFNMPVTFKYLVTAPDANIGGIGFNSHGHETKDGDTGKPKEV